MVRALFFFVCLSALVALGLIVASQPGDVSIHWGQYEISTSLGVFSLIILAFLITLSAAWVFVRWVLRLPFTISQAKKINRYKEGFRGLVSSIAYYKSGDIHKAFRLARQIRKKIPDPGLAFWLEARIAKKNKDPELASECYENMLSSGLETSVKFIGSLELAQLFVEQHDYEAATQYLNKAYELEKDSPRVMQGLFVMYLLQREWSLASMALENFHPQTVSLKKLKGRYQSILSYKRALDESVQTVDEKRELLSYAVEFDPSFIPAVEAYARILQSMHKNNKCNKMLEKSWTLGPSLSIASRYFALIPETQVLDRFKSAKRLLELAPTSPKSYVVVIKTALEAKLWGEAKAYFDEAIKKDIFKEKALLSSYLELCVQGDDTIRQVVWSQLRKILEKNDWQCKECGHSQASWFASCVQCKSILKCVLKSIF